MDIAAGVERRRVALAHVVRGGRVEGLEGDMLVLPDGSVVDGGEGAGLARRIVGNRLGGARGEEGGRAGRGFFVVVVVECQEGDAVAELLLPPVS